jgi:hypothetical protein
MNTKTDKNSNFDDGTHKAVVEEYYPFACNDL